MATRIEGDQLYTGSITFQNSVSLPSGSVADSSVAAGANIDADKVEQLHVKETDFGIETDTAPSTSTTYSKTMYTCKGNASLRAFRAKMVDVGTQAATHTFDFELKKAAAGSTSFSTMLSAAESIGSTSTDNTYAVATLASTTLVAGDTLQIELVAPATITAAAGPAAELELTEIPT